MNLLDLGPDKARYRRIDARGVGKTACGGRPALRVADGALAALAARVGQRLRAKGLAGRTVTVKLRFSDFTTKTVRRTPRVSMRR